MPTTGFQAGFESNSVLLSYGLESIYGQLPPVAFQALRLTSETLSGTKTRKAPQELVSTGEMPQNVTLQEQAGGAINFVLSFGTYDDFLAASLGNTWSATTVINSISGDTSIAVGGVITSTLATKFTAVTVGMWVMLSGFTNAVNNGVFRVQSKASNASITVSPAYVAGVVSPFIAETPAGALFTLRCSTIVNGTSEQTFFTQKRFSAAVFLRYPGCFVQSFTITGSTANFITGSFTMLPTAEVQATTDASTGTVLAANARPAMAGVAKFGGVFLNEAPIGAVLDSFTLTCTNTGSALEFGLGQTTAQGFLEGLQTCTGQLKLYFNSLALYNNFKSEVQGRLAIMCGDAYGNVYVFTVLNAALMNPNVQAGAQNTAVWATFSIEGNPQAGGGTIQIDRLMVQ